MKIKSRSTSLPPDVEKQWPFPRPEESEDPVRGEEENVWIEMEDYLSADETSEGFISDHNWIETGYN